MRFDSISSCVLALVVGSASARAQTVQLISLTGLRPHDVTVVAGEAIVAEYGA